MVFSLKMGQALRAHWCAGRKRVLILYCPTKDPSMTQGWFLSAFAGAVMSTGGSMLLNVYQERKRLRERCSEGITKEMLDTVITDGGRLLINDGCCEGYSVSVEKHCQHDLQSHNGGAHASRPKGEGPQFSPVHAANRIKVRGPIQEHVHQSKGSDSYCSVDGNEENDYKPKSSFTVPIVPSEQEAIGDDRPTRKSRIVEPVEEKTADRSGGKSGKAMAWNPRDIGYPQLAAPNLVRQGVGLETMGPEERAMRTAGQRQEISRFMMHHLPPFAPPKPAD